LYDLGVVDIDKGKQCGARRQYRFQRLFQAPVLAKFRDWSRLEIKCEEFCQLLDSERTGSYGNA
jgi:hypothetical protein